MFFESNNKILYSDTLLPDIFISEYMPSMDGDCLKIYIHCLFLSKYNKFATSEELSKKLGIDINKTRDYIFYLESIGVITRKDKNNSIVLVDLKEKEINKIYRMKSSSSPEEAVLSSNRNKKRSKLVTTINNTFFQGTMSPSWYTDIDVWFDLYKFEEDVMFALFQYCYDHSGLNKNYLVKVAEAWYNKKIVNSFDLDNYSIEYQIFKDIRGKIFKKLKRKAPLTEYEEDCIKKWVTVYSYDFDIIEIALKKTMAKAEANFKYIDTIITNWYSAGLKTKEAIMAQDVSNKPTIRQSKDSSTPQRGNFEQRKYDDDYYNNLYKNVKKTKTV
jgi:DnaD/phage-associated family protein